MKTNEYRWEWLDGDLNQSLKWICYEQKYQKIFNEALENKLNSVRFDLNEIKFKIDLSLKMTQTNLRTSFERPIRFTVQDEDKNNVYSYWQWLNDDNQKWTNYTPCITIQLETNYAIYQNNENNSASLKLNIAETVYSIDFSKMTQTNEKTGYRSRIKRVVSDATNLVKQEVIQVEEEIIMEENEENSRPSSNLRKRKNLSNSDRSLSTASTISVSSSDSVAVKSKKASARNEAIDEEPIIVEPESVKKEPEEQKTNKSDTKNRKKPMKKDKKEESEDEDESKPTKSGPKTKAKKSSKKIKKEDDEEPAASTSKSAAKETIKTIKFTGDIPLDEIFIEQYGSNYMIYREGDLIYDAMLNQTNLQYNNNKYYLIQLLQQMSTKQYFVWLRWGRVGKAGQVSYTSYGSNLNSAKDFFNKKFYDKTRNDFESSKDSFEKVPGKYDLVDKDYSSTGTTLKDEVDSADKPKIEIPPSKLDKNLQNLIELICNVTEMENLLKEMKFDSEKAPLGKLSKNQIKAGYAALKEIEEHITNRDFGSSFIQANNDFYTRIPHSFGMKTPPLIRTPQQMREKMKLLEVLDEIEVAVKALNQQSSIINPVDRHYDQLECDLQPLNHNDKMFNLIEQYLNKNHASTHSNYRLKLLEVYQAEKKTEIERFKDVGNRMLLWHGSRMTNWAGILSQGLRIAPPEAPVTGYMFGKGCYFSDCSSKSANYCYTNSSKNIGLLSLSEVSLGACNELKNADNNADRLPAGKMSVKGVGKSEPDQSEWVNLDNGCVIPIGKLKTQTSDPNSYSLLYNEFIVYDVSRIKLKYLVKVEFVYDD